jgi:pyruvate formate-lyase/glycerol dehydratase family glycyl radical enzyme
MALAADMRTLLWQASDSLSERVRRLREEYFSFWNRDVRNEVRPYSTGKAWDEVWSPHNWGVAPEIYPFMACFRDSLKACAEKVELPEGFWKEPLVVRRALFFKEVVNSYLPVAILEGELIVGSHFNTALSKNLRKDESKEWNKKVDKWIQMARRLDEHGVGNCGAVPGHLIPNYPKVLREGFRGINETIRQMIEITPAGKERDQLRAMMICTEAVRPLSERYAAEAERQAAACTDHARRGELEAIAAMCRQVPWNPARTFHEAVQSVWFAHMLVMVAESYPGPGLSLGRFDQYMYPFYRKDLEAGSLSKDQAREILRCYWIKHNYAYDYQGRIGQNQGINSGFGQLITIGGMGPHGEDRTNELSWLLLDVIEEMNMLEPKPNVRIHAGTPKDFLDRVCQLVAKAQGSPFLINFDEASIRALKWAGLPEDELWDYAPVGCLENTLQGKDRSGTVDVNVNLAKSLELALNDGKDMLTGRRLGISSGPPERFVSFESFMGAYKRQLSHALQELIVCTNLADSIRAEFEPTPYLSCLVDGCADKGKDITQGGALYNFITIEGLGLATAGDSCAAIKKLIYEEKRLSMTELVQAMRDNYDGHERIRQMLINKAPKYGNDIEYVDSIAREISRFWTQKVFRYYSPATGKRYRAGYLSWNYWIAYAPKTAATPDGRKRGTYLSNGVCPVTGMNRQGPTAEARSVAHLGLDTVPSGDSHTMSLSPSVLRTAEHISKLAALLRTYVEEGGTALQLNILDPDTLKNAQRHPDEYKNLLVRVTGYNAYFVMLGKEIQDEIISREAHVMG